MVTLVDAPGNETIACDTNPFIPQGWSIQEEDQLPNRVRERVTWDSTKISLILHPKQKRGTIDGCEIRDWLIDKPVYRANVLDYLLTSPHLIPNEWKPREGEVNFIFFWGDIYRNSDRLLYVRWLYWDADECGSATIARSLLLGVLATFLPSAQANRWF